MLKDALLLGNSQKPTKIPSKETLNHYELIKLASGIDPYVDTQAAYLQAYKSLGIDIINRIPFVNKTRSLAPGQSRKLDENHTESYLGLYETVSRTKFPFSDPDDFLEVKEFFLSYDRLITPVPGKLDRELIEKSMRAAGEIGLYYYMYYTTLFMWGVEWLGTELFLTAAAIDPECFDKYFLNYAFRQTQKDVDLLSDISGTPFVFLHDDLANALSPFFRMDWYEKYIFPRYKTLFKEIKAKGKKIIFVADGNMEAFFSALLECGVDGVMLENPATSFDKILKAFSGKIIIGGVETEVIAFKSPREVAAHTEQVIKSAINEKGFVLSTPGGIHGNIPIANLIAYFDTRAKYGITEENWQKR